MEFSLHEINPPCKSILILFYNFEFFILSTIFQILFFKCKLLSHVLHLLSDDFYVMWAQFPQICLIPIHSSGKYWHWLLIYSVYYKFWIIVVEQNQWNVFNPSEIWWPKQYLIPNAMHPPFYKMIQPTSDLRDKALRLLLPTRSPLGSIWQR